MHENFAQEQFTKAYLQYFRDNFLGKPLQVILGLGPRYYLQGRQINPDSLTEKKYDFRIDHRTEAVKLMNCNQVFEERNILGAVGNTYKNAIDMVIIERILEDRTSKFADMNFHKTTTQFPFIIDEISVYEEDKYKISGEVDHPENKDQKLSFLVRNDIDPADISLEKIFSF